MGKKIFFQKRERKEEENGETGPSCASVGGEDR